jgi:chromosome partitioning protein
MKKDKKIVVFGNSKGGTGKSTLALHVAIALIHQGRRVACLDLDAGQGTFSRHIENRKRLHPDLAAPSLEAVAEGIAEEAFTARVVALYRSHDVLVIDTPGADTPLARLGHAVADLIVTPLNDSLVDFDVLARVDPQTMRIQSPSRYSEMVWEAKKRRALANGGSIDWVVTRNRLSALESRNKREVERLLRDLAKRISFRMAPGLTERVVYRELFLKGLTLLDLREEGAGVALNLSHVAARQELRNLVDGLGL